VSHLRLIAQGPMTHPDATQDQREVGDRVPLRPHAKRLPSAGRSPCTLCAYR